MSWECKFVGTGDLYIPGGGLGENSSRIGLQVVHHITSRLSTKYLRVLSFPQVSSSFTWILFPLSTGGKLSWCSDACFITLPLRVRRVARRQFKTRMKLWGFLRMPNWGRFGQTGVAEGVEIWAIFRQRKIGRYWKCIGMYWIYWKCYPSSHLAGYFCWSTSDPVSLPFQGVPLASCLEKCSLHPSCRCRPHKIFQFSFQDFPPHILSPSCAISHQLSPSNFEFLIGQLHFGTGSPVAWDLINASVPGRKSGVKERWQ